MISTEGFCQPWRGERSNLNYRADKLSLISRLYVWSIVLEPLLIFIMFDATTTGFTANLSKMLQLIVLAGLLLKLLNNSLSEGLDGIRLVNFSNSMFVNFRNYFALTVFAGLVGLMSGAYNLPFEYRITYTDVSGFSEFVNSSYVRPVIEYFILLYYFCYFVVLPKYLLNNNSKIEYFFSVFKKFFIVSFVLGVVDLGLSANGINLIPRNLTGETWISGMRYHGLAGEPRDAFVYLFLGLAILHLQAYYRGVRLSKWWIGAIILGAVATQSASGLVGIVVFCGLYFFYSLRKISVRKIILLLTLYLAISLLVYVSIVSSERMLQYLEAASGIWDILESKSELPYLMSLQMVNIYPVYDLTVKLRDSNFLPILIGSGLGSTSVINNFIPGIEFNALANPHSQIARIIYENGVVGTYLFVRVFTHPVIVITKHLSSKVQYELILLTLLLLGCILGNRSSASFIYLGVLIAVFRVFDLDRSSRINNVGRDRLS